jgi:hypothetical protein
MINRDIILSTKSLSGLDRNKENYCKRIRSISAMVKNAAFVNDATRFLLIKNQTRFYFPHAHIHVSGYKRDTRISNITTAEYSQVSCG